MVYIHANNVLQSAEREEILSSCVNRPEQIVTRSKVLIKQSVLQSILFTLPAGPASLLLAVDERGQDASHATFICPRWCLMNKILNL